MIYNSSCSVNMQYISAVQTSSRILHSCTTRENELKNCSCDSENNSLFIHGVRSLVSSYNRLVCCCILYCDTLIRLCYIIGRNYGYLFLLFKRRAMVPEGNQSALWHGNRWLLRIFFGSVVYVGQRYVTWMVIM